MKLPRPYISHSQLSTFTRCGEQYRRAYIDKERIPPGVAAIRGRAVHAAAKVNFRQKVESTVDLPLADLVDATATAFDQDAEKGYTLTPDERSAGAQIILGKAKDRAVAMTGVLAQQLAPTLQPTMVEKEVRLTVPRGDDATVDLLGIVDLVDTAQAIRDLKTSGKRYAADAAHDSTQLTWYALSYHALLGSWPSELRLDVIVDTKVPTLQRLVTARDADDGRALAARISAMIRAVEAEVFIPAPVGSWWCSPKWCGYWNTCRFVNSFRRAAAEAAD